MTGREMYEQWCAFAGVVPAWPNSPAENDRTVKAWDLLAASVEDNAQARVARAVLRRDGDKS